MNRISRTIFILGLGIFLLLLILAVFYFNNIFIDNASEKNPTETNGEVIWEKIDPTRNMGGLVTQNLIVPVDYKNRFSPGERKLSLPSSLEISVFIAGLNRPRSLVFDKENNLFVTDIGQGSVFLIKDTDNNGSADNIIEVDGGLNNPHGIDFYDNDLYVAEEHQVVVYRDLDSSGRFGKKEVLISELPRGKGHSTRTVHIGPDGKIYLSIGSSCNVCEESDERRASIIRYDLEGRQEMIVASGLRNTVGFTFRREDNNFSIWGVDNGRDYMGDDLPEEEINIINPYPDDTEHFGWPYCYGDKIADANFSQSQDFCPNTISPRYKFWAHSAPLGIAFGSGINNLPRELQGDIFIALHGSWNRSAPVGYKIMRIDDNGSGDPQDFITGWLENNGQAWGRPVDIRFSLEGEMFITDDKAGSIYKVKSKMLPL